MISLHSWGMVVFFKVYVAIALITATILSPLALSFSPIFLVIWYAVLWRWPVTPVVNLLTEYFMLFVISLLLAPLVGPFFSLLIALPVLLLINHALKEAAESLTYHETRYRRWPTTIGLTLPLIAIVLLAVSLLLGSLPLLLASAVAIIYFGLLGVLVLKRLPSKPVAETQVEQRMLAGTEGQLYFELVTETQIGGLLFLESPYEWLQLSPNVLSLKEPRQPVAVSLSPALSGPSVVKLKAYATDGWGLIQTSFELEPIRLYVIPRARYAAWLAKKYLAGTKAGTLPISSNITELKPVQGLRRGVEYYGSQLYQPGDSLKSIDWKHSLKYNELITKEFTEFHGQSAVILMNLAVGDAEEADKLAYKIIITALSLAKENIPAALAAYNHEGVKLTTTLLQPRELVPQSLKIAQEMVTFINPVKYLNPPDVDKLRGNISRIQFVESKAAKVLAQLLLMEFKNLNITTRAHPATRALSEVFSKTDRQSNIVIISNQNHDAAALAFNKFQFARKGNAVITV